jgi:hypothetical protein
MIRQQPDPIKLEAKIKELKEWEVRNAEPYDKAILTLSSGALALSLTFIKDLVPPELALANLILYLAWVLFVLSLGTNITGFIYTLKLFPRQRKFAEAVYKHCIKTEDQYNVFFEKINAHVDRFNMWQGIFFLAGMVAFTVYVIINHAAHANSVHQSTTTVSIAAKPAHLPADPAPIKNPQP